MLSPSLLVIFSLLALVSEASLLFGVRLGDQKVFVYNNGVLLNPSGEVTLTSNVFTITNLPVSWYKEPVNVTLDEIGPPYDTFLQSLNADLSIVRVSPLLYHALFLDSIPNGFFFGGRTNFSFVCDPTVQTTRERFSCHQLNSTGGLGEAVASIEALPLSPELDGVAPISNASIIKTDFAWEILPGMIIRLDNLLRVTNDMSATLSPHNNKRRNDSKIPVGFAIFFLILAMASILVTVTVLLAWVSPLPPFLPQGNPYRTSIYHFLMWFSITSLLLLITALAARSAGWVILGAIYFLLTLILLPVYFYYQCSSSKIEKEIEMGSSSKELTPGPFSIRPAKLSLLQRFLTIGFSICFALSLISLGICYAAWHTSEYFVWNRETGLAVVEIQPAAVSKSTLALYSFDGLARTVDLNFFLDVFTDWCGDYYRKNLTTQEKESKILTNYIQLYQIDMSTFEPSDYLQYSNVNEFFIRTLRPGTRPIASPLDPRIFVSPADARLLIIPQVPRDFSIVIKEEGYSLADLLGSAEESTKYVNGPMMIVRLAPQDYHRYHAPINGTVLKRTPLVGSIFSVNADAVRSGNQVFLNKRVVSFVQTTNFGQVAFVAVGATCVGSIVDHFGEGSVWGKGDQVGQFEYGGSTIVLFFEPNKIIFDDDLSNFSSLGVETLVKMGTQIGISTS